jgi:thioredoxin-like negative regulator of GroEL
MPTFLLVKDGNVVDKLVGASPQQLMKMVETHK